MRSALLSMPAISGTRSQVTGSGGTIVSFYSSIGTSTLTATLVSSYLVKSL